MRRTLLTLGVTAVAALGGAAPAQAVPCSGVQAALDAAPDNGTVVVDEGTCSSISLTLKPRPSTALVTLEGAGLGATFEGGDPSSATKRILTGSDVGVIRLRNLTFENSVAPDGEGGGAMRLTGDSAAIFEDFVVNSSRADPGQDGGGALIQSTSSQPTVVEDSLFGDPTYTVANRARNGAGLAIENAAQAGEVQISNSRFDGNSATGSGGGLYVVQPGPGSIRVLDSEANDNGAGVSGGGMALMGAEMRVERTELHTNGLGTGVGGVHSGGGIYVGRTVPAARILQQGNRFTLNLVSAHGAGAVARGGGEWAQGVSVTSANDRFTENAVSTREAGSRSYGGGLGITSCAGTATLTAGNMVAAANGANVGGFGGGVYAGACQSGHVAATIQSSTIAGNFATGARPVGGLYGTAASSLVLRNSIVAANNGGVDLRGFGQRTIRFSDACAPAVPPGQGNICADPVFVDLGVHGPPDVHQTQSSPTIDRGCDCFVGSNPPDTRTQDFEGDHRVHGPRVDMGADEFAAPWPLAARVASVGPFDATLQVTAPPNVCFYNVRFQYGRTRAYGRITAPVAYDVHCRPLPVHLTGLRPGTTYHFRVVASNYRGMTVGLDQTFKTRRDPFRVGLADQTVHLENGRAPVRVHCPAGTPGDCRGRLRLRMGGHDVGSAHFFVREGGSPVVQVPVARATRDEVRRRGHLDVSGIATAHDAYVTRTSRATVTLEPPL